MMPELLERIQPQWQALTGAPLEYTPPEAPAPHSRWRTPLEHDGESLGWLSVPVAPEAADEIQLISWLSLCGRLVSASLGERKTADSLGDEVLAAWNQLAFLYEVLKVNSFKASIEEVAEKLSTLACGVFRCDNAFLAYRDSTRAVYRSASPLEDELIQRYFAQLEHTAVFVANDQQPNFLGARVPLTTAGEAIIGMLGSQLAAGFRAHERQLADSLAEQIGTVLDNIALQKQLASNVRLQHELEIAAQIQSSLIPARLPRPAGYELAGVVVPASQVGGDFYDVVESGDGALALLLGDVAGKGIPAAMLTSLIRAELRGQVLAGRSPGEAIARANTTLEPDFTKLDMFATALVARLEPVTHTLTYASAGHTATCHWQAATRRAFELPSTALPLGLFPESENVERSLALRPEDVLVCYSDGVTEALGPSGRLFGWAGLDEAMALAHAAPPAVAVQMILQAIDAHRGPQAVGDDLTLLVLKRAQPQPEIAARGFVLAADVTQLKHIDPALQATLSPWAGEAGLDTWRHELGLAITEHVSNILRHAYGSADTGRIYGLFTRHADYLVLETLDSGRPFDPARMPARNTNLREALRLEAGDLPESGYGLPLIRGVMDEVEYERRDGIRNYWRLARRVKSA
jgi:serine phosphatase RsbU (regulator of sigma subunit)/anti-sigma regulatory factor (Ser/Thr protein kinase)